MAMGKGVSLSSGETPRGIHVVRVTLLPIDIRTVITHRLRSAETLDEAIHASVNMSLKRVAIIILHGRQHFTGLSFGTFILRAFHCIILLLRCVDKGHLFVEFYIATFRRAAPNGLQRFARHKSNLRARFFDILHLLSVWRWKTGYCWPTAFRPTHPLMATTPFYSNLSAHPEAEDLTVSWSALEVIFREMAKSE